MDLSELWRQKTDDEIAAASQQLSDYSGEAQRVIRAEMHQRGIPETEGAEKEVADRPEPGRTETTNTSANAYTEWTVQTQDGRRVGSFSRDRLLEGVRAGWIRLEDLIAMKNGDWKSIRDSLGRTDFDFQVYVDPSAALGGHYAWMFGAVVSLIALSIALHSTYSDFPSLTPIQHLILTAGSVIAVALTFVGWMFLPKGFILIGAVVFIGIPILSAAAAVEARALLTFLFNFWVYMPLMVAIGAGYCAGWWVGGSVGRRIGARCADEYRLPTERTPMPPGVSQ